MFEQGFDVTVETTAAPPQCVPDFQINASFVINGQRFNQSRRVPGQLNIFGRNYRGLYIADVGQFDVIIGEMRRAIAQTIAAELHPRVYLEGR